MANNWVTKVIPPRLLYLSFVIFLLWFYSLFTSRVFILDNVSLPDYNGIVNVNHNVQTKRNTRPTQALDVFEKSQEDERLRTKTEEAEIYSRNNRPQAGINEGSDCQPVNTRLYPLCADKVKYLKNAYILPCFKDAHGVDSSSCSILNYFKEIEPFCWHDNIYTAKVQQHHHQKIHFNSNLNVLLNKLPEKYWDWVKRRISQMWPLWIETINSLKQNSKILKRKKLKVLFYPASLEYNVHFLEKAGKGGPVGELVQWADVVSCVFILGHDVSFFYKAEDLKRYIKGTRDDKCLPKNPEKVLSNYDIVFTDLNGHRQLTRLLGGSIVGFLKCKLRLVDSFGTEAEFNYFPYSHPIPGGQSHWAGLSLILQQIMTLYPHSPDNSFLGFVVGKGSQSKLPKKKPKALIYGKLGRYFHGKEEYLKIVHEFFEVHSTANGEGLLPDFIVNHGVVNQDKLIELLKESKLFVGLGFPYEGPAPLEAIANGAVYLNPKFTPPKDRLNEHFFAEKPTFRKITSQNPYMEEFVGEPYTYTIDIKDHKTLRETLKKIKDSDDLSPYIPHEFTFHGMAERLNAYFEHQNFCDERAPVWPPISSQQVFIADEGISCKSLCHKRGLVCEPRYFHDLNKINLLSRHGFDCSKIVTSQLLYSPSFNLVNKTCHIQSQPILYSCVSASNDHQRLCPCRDYIKGQIALCKDCL